MKTNLLTSQMHNNARSIASLVTGISDDQARWRPDPDSWSMLEVIHHLYDEEKLDFRVRLGTTLGLSTGPWPPIDPVGWVNLRAYNKQDPSEILDSFLRERDHSLEWLKGLENPDWTAVYHAPWGEISAGDIFASWVVHDLLHLRQLVELHWAYTNKIVHPHKVDYAGGW